METSRSILTGMKSGSKDQIVNLTAAEFKLLAVIGKNSGRVFTRLQAHDRPLARLTRL